LCLQGHPFQVFFFLDQYILTFTLPSSLPPFLLSIAESQS
jgi:hypothetical protein